MTDHPDDSVEAPGLAGPAASMREEWRSEQEAASRDALEQWQHVRTLVDVLVECMHRGDRVAVQFGHHRFTGEVVDVADDLVSLRTVGARVDLHLHDAVPLRVLVSERSRSGGTTAEAPGSSFRARLLALEATGDEITVGTTLDPEPVNGRLVVGRDQCCIVGRGGGETFVRLSAVAYAMPRHD